MPRTPWRRRSTDSPRPAGRLAGQLRRSGSIARQVLLVRVGGRRAAGDAAGTDLPIPRRPRYAVFIRPRAPRDPYRTAYPDRGATGGLVTPGAAVATGMPVAPPGMLPAVLPGVLVGPGDRSRRWPERGGVPATGTTVAAPAPLLPGEQTPARRARFVLANACTVGSLLLGMLSIFLSMHGELRVAAGCLVGGVVFDGLDGALARRLGVASPFGAQLDSLADMCTFGIATPVVVYTSLSHTAPTAPLAAACALLAATAAIRLARFNVSPRDGRFFAGVPTTMAAAVLSVGTLIGVRLPGPVALTVITVLGLAMVSGFPYAKLSRIAKLPPWLLLAPLLGSLVDYRITFVVVVLAYLASGPALWLRRHAAAA